MKTYRRKLGVFCGLAGLSATSVGIGFLGTRVARAEEVCCAAFTTGKCTTDVTACAARCQPCNGQMRLAHDRSDKCTTGTDALTCEEDNDAPQIACFSEQPCEDEAQTQCRENAQLKKCKAGTAVQNMTKANKLTGGCPAAPNP
jgi:hypothetical protein